MQFLIADSFTDSLSRLNGDEQKAVKTTAFDLQMNSANPGMSFHRLDKARDKNFWSVRASSDIRIIVHKTSGSLLLCYVDHHDDAYSWAERRKLETHPTTGAAQIVEIRETVKEIVIPSYIQSEEPEKAPAPPLFRAESDESLLKYGVPPEWLDDVRALTDEDALLTLAERLPTEAAEALLELATGGKPAIPEAAKETSPFEHPDAKRRFRIVQMRTSSSRRSITPGKSGLSSSTPASANGSSATTTAPPASQAPQAQGKPLSPYTVPHTLLAPNPRPEFSSPHSPKRSPAH